MDTNKHDVAYGLDADGEFKREDLIAFQASLADLANGTQCCWSEVRWGWGVHGDTSMLRSDKEKTLKAASGPPQT